MVLGGTAAGKTTALNSMACLIKPGSKIITIEETAELNLPLENWVSLISRQSYGLGGSGVGEVALFDLVKTSMRHRPDILVVGEVSLRKLLEARQPEENVAICPEDVIKVGLPMELTVRVGGKDKEGNDVVVYKWKPKSN
jgi:energy-coupling factor transporter ATP-binding protein EcfA2